MSILFLDESSNTVWFPGNLTARIFHGQVHVMARILDVEAGLGPIERDEVVIDVKRFTAFVSAFAAWMRKLGSVTARSMVDGCFSIAAALAEKLGATTDDYGFDDLVERGRRLIG